MRLCVALAPAACAPLSASIDDAQPVVDAPVMPLSPSSRGPSGERIVTPVIPVGHYLASVDHHREDGCSQSWASTHTRIELRVIVDAQGLATMMLDDATDSSGGSWDSHEAPYYSATRTACVWAAHEPAVVVDAGGGEGRALAWRLRPHGPEPANAWACSLQALGPSTDTSEGFTLACALEDVTMRDETTTPPPASGPGPERRDEALRCRFHGALPRSLAEVSRAVPSAQAAAAPDGTSSVFLAAEAASHHPHASVDSWGQHALWNWRAVTYGKIATPTP